MNHIKCERWHLEARCKERGYTTEEVMPCVVSEKGDDLVVDVDHEAYPLLSRIPQPGTALRKLLASWPLRIKEDPSCACRSHAAQMDMNEKKTPGWCNDNIDTIVGWLREQASERGLPFVNSAGKFLVNRAIAKSYREAESAKRSSLPDRR